MNSQWSILIEDIKIFAIWIVGEIGKLINWKDNQVFITAAGTLLLISTIITRIMYNKKK